MSISADELRPQAMAALETFEKMSAKERETQVSKYFAERTNVLINMGREAMPTVSERRWPQLIPIRVSISNMGGNGEATYADIRAILAELGAILAAGLKY
jgi:hypothetical protein